MFNCLYSHIFQNPDGWTTNLAEVLRYPIPTKDVMRNKARAATAWFGDFTEKVMTFPEYEMFTKTPGWLKWCSIKDPDMSQESGISMDFPYNQI